MISENHQASFFQVTATLLIFTVSMHDHLSSQVLLAPAGTKIYSSLFCGCAEISALRLYRYLLYFYSVHLIGKWISRYMSIRVVGFFFLGGFA